MVMDWVVGLITRYWWIGLLILGVVLLIKIFGTEDDNNRTSGPCEVDGASGCM